MNKSVRQRNEEMESDWARRKEEEENASFSLWIEHWMAVEFILIRFELYRFEFAKNRQ